MTSPGPGRKLKLQILPPPPGCGGGGLGPRGILKGGLSGLLGEEPWRRFQRKTPPLPPSEYCSSTLSAANTAIPTRPWKLE